MKFEEWNPSSRNEIEYARSIYDMLRQYFRSIEDFTERLLAPPEWVDEWANYAAQRMVRTSLSQNARSWRQAARETMRGGRISRALKMELAGPVGARYRNLVAENAQLIRSLPLEISEKVTAKIAELSIQGERSTTLRELQLAKYTDKLIRSRAQLIARTETSKASTALTRARAEELNLQWYVWRTSKDARVRASHRKMEGVIFNWNDPPSPEVLIGEKSEGYYNAGDIYNCRCYAEPLMRFSQVAWPHKVYYGGRITGTTLAAFRQIAVFNQYEALVA